MNQSGGVPRALRNWFVLHFAMDMLFAIPLMVAPEILLKGLGWQNVDPFTARLVAAALFGIGIESLRGRHAGREAYLGMLSLKIVWSLAAILGIGWSIFEDAQGAPPAAWLVLLAFVVFNGVWLYWRREISRVLDSPTRHR